MSSSETLAFYENIENVEKLCNFLRGTEGPPVREAVEMDKRVYYLKGEKKENKKRKKDTAIIKFPPLFFSLWSINSQLDFIRIQINNNDDDLK